MNYLGPVSIIQRNPLRWYTFPGLRGATESPMPRWTTREWEDGNEKAGGGRACAGRADRTSGEDRQGAVRQAYGERRGSSRSEEKKTTPLVGDVSEYGGLYRRLQRGGRPDKKEEVIRFRSYNIWNGRNGVLELALRRNYHANIDLGILQETKVTGGVLSSYFLYLHGFISTLFSI